MRKLYFIFAAMLLIAQPDSVVWASSNDGIDQSPASSNRLPVYQENNTIGPFSVYANPLGVLQFGPMMGVEIKLAENFILNLNTRLPRFGLLSYVVRGWDDVYEIRGFGVAAVPIIFFTDNQHKPYAGAGLEYDRSKVLYNEGYYDENTEFENNIIIVTNGGYRFRFSSGLFLSAGLYIGASFSIWEEEHVDPVLENYSGLTVQPFGMAELKVGYEF